MLVFFSFRTQSLQGEASLKFLLCLWLWRSVSPSYARSGISKQKFEMKKHLNWLNKSAQPDFDHSLLKDIQVHRYNVYLDIITILKDSSITTKCLYEVRNRRTYISLSYGIDMNAIAYVEGDNYYGAKATINVWEPKIQQQHKFTFLQIWLFSDLFRKYLNNIEAGWQ
ncbi:hypothetical protein HID58_075155, partial [Brassica napus]